jgi:hypothetical protein
VPVGVVDLPEGDQVDEQQRGGASGALAPQECLAERASEPLAVRQPSQRVVVHQVPHLLLGLDQAVTSCWTPM